MSTPIDGLVSPTLKHLREGWWDDAFTEFLVETLRPRAGSRILDVGCGEGEAEVSIGRQHVSQIRLIGVDLVWSKVVAARARTSAHNQRVSFAAADACALPFKDGSFDAIYCVAVLQHVVDVAAAVREFQRVLGSRGRVLVVEPDNAARYTFSSVPSGARTFEIAARFFAARSAEGGESTDASIGPKLPQLFARHGIEPTSVRLFPVSSTQLGAVPPKLWESRRAAITREIEAASSPSVRGLGQEVLGALSAYEADARDAGPSFVEIQNTLLLATVGQKDA